MATRTTPTRKRRRRASSSLKVQAGLPPGSPIYSGEPREDQVRISVIDYHPGNVREAEQISPEALAPFAQPGTISWINVDGVHQVEVVQAVCEVFGIHPLVVEDILTPGERPKVEDHGDVLVVTTRMVRLAPANGGESTGRVMPREALESDAVALDIDTVTLVAGPSWVLSFQEKPGDLWGGVRERIRAGRGRIRKMGPDYLLHALLDGIVDGYFEALEAFDLVVEGIEEDVLQEASEHGAQIPRRAHAVRGQLYTLRRYLWPLQEGVGGMLRGQVGHITAPAHPFFRDLHDHLGQALEIIESNRDRLLGVVDLHLSLASHRMNDTMRVLTVVATIFIPLTFVAGVYGMNFQHMPELHYRYGYPGAMAAMGFAALAMVAWFRRKGWL